MKELRGFRHVTLGPGETRTVELTLGPSESSFLDREMHRVVCGDCPAWKFLGFGGTQNTMPSDEFLTSVFKGFRLHLCCRGSGYDREPGIADACKARHLQHQVFIRAEAVDVGFDRLAQSFWYLYTNALKRNVDSNLPCRE